MAGGGSLVFESREVDFRVEIVRLWDGFKNNFDSDVLRIDKYLTDIEGRELVASSLVDGVDLWEALNGRAASSESDFYGETAGELVPERLQLLYERTYFHTDRRTSQMFRLRRGEVGEDPWNRLLFVLLNRSISSHVHVFLATYETSGSESAHDIVLAYELRGTFESIGGVELDQGEEIYLPLGSLKILWDQNVTPMLPACDWTQYLETHFLPLPVFDFTGNVGEKTPGVEVTDKPWDPLAVWK